MHSYKILAEDSHSEHHLIQAMEDSAPTHKEAIFNTNKEKLNKLISALELAEPHLPTTNNIEGFVGNLTSSLQICIDKDSTQVDIRRKTLPWWSPELEALKRCLRTLSRKINRGRHLSIDHPANYKSDLQNL